MARSVVTPGMQWQCMNMLMTTLPATHHDVDDNRLDADCSLQVCL